MAWMQGSGTTTDGAAPDANWVAEYARNKHAALPSPSLSAFPYRRTQFEQYSTCHHTPTPGPHAHLLKLSNAWRSQRMHRTHATSAVG